MSDIVERLRQVAAAYKSLPTSGIWATMTVDRDASCNNLTDAADEIERLWAEVAGLREELAQKVVDQTMLTGLTVQDGGLTMGLQGGAAGLLAEMLTQQFKDGGGINYLQLSFTSSVALPGEAFIVTVQKCSGKTPHQLRMEAEAEAAGLREFVEHVRRNGSAHLANMAIAVLAARKGEA